MKSAKPFVTLLTVQHLTSATDQRREISKTTQSRRIPRLREPIRQQFQRLDRREYYFALLCVIIVASIIPQASAPSPIHRSYYSLLRYASHLKNYGHFYLFSCPTIDGSSNFANYTTIIVGHSRWNFFFLFFFQRRDSR